MYESLIYNHSHLIIALFTAKCSTWSKILLKDFSALPTDYNVEKNDEPFSGKDIQKVFLHVDVDECPRAAYHADVDVGKMICFFASMDDSTVSVESLFFRMSQH